MASFTLTRPEIFPNGTTVGAYPLTNWPVGLPVTPAAPLGSATNEQTVSAGSATFTGLTEGVSYVAYGLVGSAHRYIGFKVGTTLSDDQDKVRATLFDAKGDLLVGSGNDAGDNLGVGTDGQALVADSGETLGVKWSTPSSVSQSALAGGQAGIMVPQMQTFPFDVVALPIGAHGYFVRFTPIRSLTVTAIGFYVTTADGSNTNCDVGLYSAAGAKLVSAGATASKLNSTGVKSVTVTGQALTAGTVYYAGFSAAAAGASLLAAGGGGGGSLPNVVDVFGATLGVKEMFYHASAHPLPANATITDTTAVPILWLKE